MTRQRIAIIGSGIAGLTCAHHLATEHDLTIFEAEDYVGGHTHTVQVEKQGEISDIDTGFIVFNDRTYPEFIKMMDSIGVNYQPTEMSFSVRNDAADLEYNGNTINSLFAQRKNIVRPGFLRMVRDIVRFNKEVLRAADDEQLTIGDFLATRKYSVFFRDNYLLPMISAIWSMGLESCKDFPLQFFVRFFDNHGLLNIINRPQWYTIIGGSSSYIKPLTAPFKDRIRVSTPVIRVERDDAGVQIVTTSETERFDQVIFACHGNQALSLLAAPTSTEEEILQPFKTSSNSVVLHTDTALLPKRRLGWASWNYNMVDSAKEQTTLTYNMNILQRLSKQHTYLVTLNQEIAKEHILKEFNYHHPIFSLEAIEAQTKWENISGKNRSHYCGAYWFNGFHEDGVKSGLRVKNAIEEML
ncbi:NAD(P)/FAD-dependent oxidoreductase [Desulforhopalus sp. 52FAK]